MPISCQMVFWLLAPIVGLAATSMFADRVHVDIDGQRDFARVIRELGIRETMTEMSGMLGEALDALTTNSAQMTANVERNMSSVSSDFHNATFYFRMLMIALTAYTVVLILRGIYGWICDVRREKDHDIVILITDGGFRVRGLLGQSTYVVSRRGTARRSRGTSYV
ncbi:hypothetical protein WOLCODRAFT_137705 [Wolfiporia cocos MD-104 SS10]|uniref:Plasma membrane fusion protein PRM1 n=1 Tax=Wolfiporia cocos (strain MD-104) TaxID=742152 RepID=A0A2H3JIV0_WOLCO|nr:hypothetical protein WOLCODRAFT_137705 [Wolfiporia cocos MD-104 SS10]